MRAVILRRDENGSHRVQVGKRVMRVLTTLLAAPEGGLSGLQLCELARRRPGSLYPLLARLERAGLVSSRWADGLEPRRRLYSLTQDGQVQARLLLGLTSKDKKVQ